MMLATFPEQFPAARRLARDVQLFAGPTNSGKTHAALEVLASAASGCYLAPLRLLALEVFQRLQARGVPVSLITGEDRIVDPSARVVCSTIEMCNFEHVVEVAVIDEVQMLGDRDRGSAWVAALLGVPAQTVIACGSDDAEAAAEAVIRTAGERMTTRAFARRGRLEVIDAAVSIDELAPGDALVAFSRSDVHSLARRVRKSGRTTAQIYGALGPEVRIEQAARFASGRADVLIATDAIGLGLNLPIKRLIFAATEKHDGARKRKLFAAEVQQLAGRAGRYADGVPGQVGALTRSDAEFVATALATKAGAVELPVCVSPTFGMVRSAMEELGTDRVSTALELLRSQAPTQVFAPTDLAEPILRARVADRYRDCDASKGVRSLSVEERYAYAFSPVPIREGQFELEMLISHHVLEDPAATPAGLREIRTLPRTRVVAQAEHLLAKLQRFSWWAHRFPGMADLDEVAAERRALSSALLGAL